MEIDSNSDANTTKKVLKQSNQASEDDPGMEFQTLDSGKKIAETGYFSENPKPIEEKSTEKTIGLIGAFSLVTGTIIGSGIFISVSATLSVAPNSIPILLFFWFLGGLISLMGGFSYVNLGILVPYSGGETTYLTKAFGEKLGTTFTVIYTCLVKGTTLAAISITTGKYVTQAAIGDNKNNEILVRLVAVSSLLIVLVLNSISKKIGNMTQIVFTGMKLGAICVIIGTGCYFMAIGYTEDFTISQKPQAIHWINLGTAFINIFWSYEGWNNLGPVVGEVKNPRRNMPIAIGAALIVIIIMYSMSILSYISVLGYSKVAQTDAVAAAFANIALPAVKWLIPLFISISTFGATNGHLLTVSRILLTSAVKGKIPSIFGLVHRSRRTPVISMLSLTIVAFFFIPFEFQVLLSYCASVTWLFYLLTMAALIKLRYKNKELDQSFNVPIFFPVIVMLVATFMVIMSFTLEPIGCAVIFLITISVYGVQFLPEKYRKIKFCGVVSFRVLKFFEKFFDLVMADSSDVS